MMIKTNTGETVTRISIDNPRVNESSLHRVVMYFVDTDKAVNKLKRSIVIAAKPYGCIIQIISHICFKSINMHESCQPNTHDTLISRFIAFNCTGYIAVHE
jgi:hypothetical protein